MTPHDDIAGRKAEVRDSARAERRAIGPAERAEASLSIARRIDSLPGIDSVRTALAYGAMSDEVDAGPAVAALRARGVRIAYPRVCGPGMLSLHWIDESESLVPGYCGIDEPVEYAPEARADELDLVLVPGTAFDEGCCRLGMGGGFYDRLLPSLRPGARAVGLAFDEQITGPLPREAHDVLLDIVVTPTRVLHRSDPGM